MPKPPIDWLFEIERSFMSPIPRLVKGDFVWAIVKKLKQTNPTTKKILTSVLYIIK